MTTTKFGPGELVNVRADGARVMDDTASWAAGQKVVRLGPVLVDLTDATVVVERVAPKEWPPQPGDKWTDRDGHDWLAVRSSRMERVILVAVNNLDERLWPQELLDAGRPTLAHRRGWTPDQTVEEAGS